MAGGLPTSLDQTGEQWDFPNAWGPLQAIVVQGLEKLGTQSAKEEAYKLADTWLQATFKGYRTSHTMFEKVRYCIIFSNLFLSLKRFYLMKTRIQQFTS